MFEFKIWKETMLVVKQTIHQQKVLARTYLQLPLRQWGAGYVYLLALSSWKVNIAEKDYFRDFLKMMKFQQKKIF
jgi:hypothetical protein